MIRDLNSLNSTILYNVHACVKNAFETNSRLLESPRKSKRVVASEDDCTQNSTGAQVTEVIRKTEMD